MDHYQIIILVWKQKPAAIATEDSDTRESPSDRRRVSPGSTSLGQKVRPRSHASSLRQFSDLDRLVSGRSSRDHENSRSHFRQQVGKGSITNHSQIHFEYLCG